MLGKIHLKPSFLLEVAFLIGVWLTAWLVFDPPVAVLVFIIFAAYGLVFLYEIWRDGLSRRERADARRMRRKESEIYRGSNEPRYSPRPSFTVEKLSKAEPVAAGHSISERLTARLHPHESEEEARSPEPELTAPVNPPAPVTSAVGTSVERPAEPIEKKTGMPEARPESSTREAAVPPAVAEGSAGSVSDAASAPRSEPAPTLSQRAEPERPHSLMAEIAAGPDARKATGPVGGWNVWQLERLLAAQVKPDPERDYERSMMLVYLREFADSDGQLPPEFDDLVRESFADLLRGPASK